MKYDTVAVGVDVERLCAVDHCAKNTGMKTDDDRLHVKNVLK